METRAMLRWPAVVAVVTLAGCAAPGPAVPAPASVPARSDVADPAALVGMWKLTGTGDGTGTVVGLTPTALTIYQPCGELSGSWRADTQGLFVGSIDAAGGGCDVEAGVPWVDEAVTYRLENGSAVLRDLGGGTVARLMRSDEPPRPDAPSFEVTDEFRRSVAPPAALPTGLAAAAREDLPGRWVPAGAESRTPQRAHLELGADGRWSGSDGCNGSGGGWVAGPGGTVLATEGVSTLVGCDNVPVGGWLSSARLAGFDGETLVLLDQDAKELGRLRRDGN